jgi:hypothetical protein
MVEIVRKTTEEEFSKFLCSSNKCKEAPKWLVKTSYERKGKTAYRKKYLCQKHLEPYKKDLQEDSEVGLLPDGTTFPKTLWQKVCDFF